MTRDTTRLTATVVGAGAGGMLSIEALLESSRFELVGVADLSPAARERIAVRTDGTVPTFESHEEMFRAAPADVICVSTYAPTHLPITRTALQTPGLRGLLVEKPLGDTAVAGAEVLSIVRESGLPVVVPHGLMAQSGALEVVEKVRSGAIGRLRFVEMECTGWDIINAGIHWIQFFATLVAPSPIVYVLAAADTSTRTFRDGMQVETEAITLARCENGVRLLLNTGDRVPMAREDTACLMRIIGDDGYIEFGAFESCYTLVSSGSERQVVEVAPYEVSGHQRHLEHLADQIASGEQDMTVPGSSLQALEIVEAAYRSAATGAAVTLPLTQERPQAVGDWKPGAPYSGRGGGRNGREL
ncbi:MAG: Gfo/Idh/MocA family protein [Humibacter sp.]